MCGAEYQRYGGNTLCVMVQEKRTLLCLDAGTGILELPKYVNLKEIDQIHIFLSHPHTDHILGFMFFKQLFAPGIRVDIYGQTVQGMTVREQITQLMRPPLWPVGPDIYQSEVYWHEMKPMQIEDISIDTISLHHPGGCLAYRLRQQGHTLVYATDTEYVGEIPKEFLSFVHECDLLLFDGQYGEEEYFQKKGWGHSPRSTGISLSKTENVGEVCLIHHDPFCTDEELDLVEKMLEKEGNNCKLALQGEEWRFDGCQ